MIVRGLNVSDLPQALTFWRAVPEVELNDSDTPEQLATYLLRNPGLSAVAFTDKDIVGAALYCQDMCGHDGRRGYLNHLAVAAPYHKRGLGKALVDYCLAHLSRVGITKCNIFVPENNAGQTFWRRLHFQEKPWALLQRSCDGA